MWSANYYDNSASVQALAKCVFIVVLADFFSMQRILVKAIGIDLIPIFSATERLVKSVFRGENGHEEVEIYGRADH
jgi:hypothetical protein